ncbi:MAG: GNAT family N-acetyltransferase [Oryzihumus sp.]
MTGPPVEQSAPRTRTARLDRALADAHARTVASLPGGEVHHLGPALLTGSRTTLRSMNGVFAFDARAFNTLQDERQLDACLAIVSTYDVPWSFNAWAHLGGPVLVEQLAHRGLVAAGEATAMWRDLVPRKVTGAGYRIEVVRRPTAAREWARTLIEVFAMDPALEPVLAGLAVRPDEPALVARVGGQPVGAVAVLGADDVSELGFLAVRRAWRGRGLGRRLAHAAEELAARRGSSAVVTLAPPGGRPLFTSLGYAPVSTVTFMVAPAPVMAASA